MAQYVSVVRASLPPTQLLVVVDEEPPVFLSCPSDVHVVTRGRDASAVVTWDLPEVVDNNRVDHVVATHSSGSAFSLCAGDQLVVYTATDDSGNVV